MLCVVSWLFLYFAGLLKGLQDIGYSSNLVFIWGVSIILEWVTCDEDF